MPFTWKFLGIALTSASLVMGGQALAEVEFKSSNLSITEEQVIAAGETWCAALVGISNTFHTEGAAAAKAKAEAVIDAAMASNRGPWRLNPHWPRVNPPSATPVKAPWILRWATYNPRSGARRRSLFGPSHGQRSIDEQGLQTLDGLREPRQM